MFESLSRQATKACLDDPTLARRIRFTKYVSYPTEMTGRFGGKEGTKLLVPSKASEPRLTKRPWHESSGIVPGGHILITMSKPSHRSWCLGRVHHLLVSLGCIQVTWTSNRASSIASEANTKQNPLLKGQGSVQSHPSPGSTVSRSSRPDNRENSGYGCEPLRTKCTCRNRRCNAPMWNGLASMPAQEHVMA